MVPTESALTTGHGGRRTTRLRGLLAAGFLASLALSALVACAKAPDGSYVAAEEAEAGASYSAADADDAPGRATGRAVAERKLIKTVDLTLTFDDSDSAAEQVRALTGTLGGFVAEMSSNRSTDGVLYRFTLRVPVERLEECVEQLKAMADRVDTESLRSEDKTAEFVDLGARLQTLVATEDELRQLLSESRERQQKAEDIMAIYRELTEIRTQIERIAAQRKVIDDLASLSTVRLQLVPSETAQPVTGQGWQPGETLHRSIRSLLAGLQFLGDFAITLVVVVLPITFIVLLPFWLLLRWLIRRIKREKASASDGADGTDVPDDEPAETPVAD